jgi:hypothetical protein
MAHVVYARLAVSQYPWVTAGTITTAQTALGADKSSDTVDALASGKTVIISPSLDSVSFDMRFKVTGGNEDDTDVANLYAMRGTDDHYTRILTMTLTKGTQTDGTNNFIDTIVGANEKWGDDIVIVSDAADGIAHIALNTHGWAKFLVIATTLNNFSSITVDWARI